MCKETYYLVISTIRYPKKSSFWSDVDNACISFDTDKLHPKVENISVGENYCIRKHLFDDDKGQGVSFIIYVVPCLKPTNDNSAPEYAISYYEEILSLLFPDSFDKDHVYLIAHEKDFGDDKNGIFATMTHLKKMQYNEIAKKLIELIELHHIYLFQHSASGIIKQIDLITSGEEDRNLCYKDCKDIYERINIKGRMINFFEYANMENKTFTLKH